MDIKTNDTVTADVTSAVDMMQSFTLRNSDGTAPLKHKPAENIDMDVDMTSNEPTPSNEMDIEPTAETHQHCSLSHANVDCNSLRVPKPQHKHISRLVGVEVKSRAPAAFSLNRVLTASVHRSSAHPLQRPVRAQERQSRLAQLALEVIMEEE